MDGSPDGMFRRPRCCRPSSRRTVTADSNRSMGLDPLLGQGRQGRFQRDQCQSRQRRYEARLPRRLAGGKAAPHRDRRKIMAGLYKNWKSPDSWIRTCTIITTDAIRAWPRSTTACRSFSRPTISPLARRSAGVERGTQGHTQALSGRAHHGVDRQCQERRAGAC